MSVDGALNDTLRASLSYIIVIECISSSLRSPVPLTFKNVRFTSA